MSFGPRRLVAVLAIGLILASTVTGIRPSEEIQAAPDVTTRVFLPQVFANRAAPPAFLGMWHKFVRDDALLTRMAESSAQWLRYNMQWEQIQPTSQTPSVYNWGPTDTELTLVTSRGIKIIANLVEPPEWSAFPVCGPFKPGMQDRFLDFAREAVKRYSKAPYNVKYWQIFNEPDHELTDPSVKWGGGGEGIGCWGKPNDTIAYANMLKQVSQAIKQIDPEAKIVIGALTADNCPFAINCSFLDDVINPAKGNAGNAFDVVSFNHYPWFRSKWERFGTSLIGKTEGHRATLRKYGLTKPVFVAEAGVRVDPDPASPVGDTDDDMTRFVPAELTWALYDSIQNPNDGIFSLAWFSLADGSDGRWGIVDLDGTPRPAYRAYQIWAKKLAGATFLANRSEKTSEGITTPGLPTPPSAGSCTGKGTPNPSCPVDEAGFYLYFNALQHYAFAVNGGRHELRVYWIDPGYRLLTTTATRTVQLPADKLIEVRDYLDQLVPTTPAGSQVNLTVSERPVYVLLKR